MRNQIYSYVHVENAITAFFPRGPVTRSRRSLSAELGAKGADAKKALEAAKETLEFANEEVEVTLALGWAERREETKVAAMEDMEDRFRKERKRVMVEMDRTRQKMEAVAQEAKKTGAMKKKKKKKEAWDSIKRAEESINEARWVGTFIRESRL